MANREFGEMLNIEQVAEWFRVSTRTIRRWIAAGKLEAFRCGTTLRFSPQQLERFQKRQAIGGLNVPESPTVAN